MKRIIRKLFRRAIGFQKINKKQKAISIVFQAMKSWRIANGDYLEFGVYEGRAFIEAYDAAKKMDFNDMRFFAFDSFEGLPAPTEDELKFDHFYEGDYKCSESNFLKNLNEHKVDLNRVVTVPGFFNKSLTPSLKTKYNIKKASVVWVDCDLYESTVPVLNFITDIIDTGTLIVFDDWFSFAGDLYSGEIRAVNEWLDKNSNIRLEHYKDFGTSGRIFLVQKIRC